jgi:hypothetical protein
MARATKKTHREFRAAMRIHAEEYPFMWINERRVRCALFAAMWFIENVSDDDNARDEIFFEVRELSLAASL